MPIFEVETNGGRYQIDAPDQAAALEALSSIPAAAENSLSGSAKALGVGAAEGLIGLAGLPADATDLATRGFDYMTGKNTNETVAPLAKTLGSQNIKKTVEGFTGEFRKPETVAEKYLQTGASFLPAAVGGPAGLAARVATRAVIPGVASEAAGQLTEGTDAEPYARVGGALAGAIGGARIASALNKPKLAAVPTKAELDTATGGGYKSQAIKDLEIDSASAGTFVDKVIGSLKKDRFSEKQAPKTYDALEGLRKAEFGANHTVADFDATRKVLNKIAGDFANATEVGSAQRAIRAIDAYTMRVPQAHVLAGDARQAGKDLFEARKNAAAGFRSQRVIDAIEKATNTAGATHSGSNLENEVRKQIRNMLNNRKQMRGFNAEEKAALEKVARGDLASNALRRVGKLLGGGGGLGQMASGGAGGAMFGWPGMVALPALGMAANKLGSSMTMSRLQKADELIRSRSPAYGPTNQAAYQQSLQGGGILGLLPPAEQMALQALLSRRPELVNQ